MKKMLKSLFSIFLVVLIILLFRCGYLMPTVENVRQKIENGLNAGDSKEKIESFLVNQEWLFTYNEFNNRFDGILKNKKSSYRAVSISIFLDKNMKFIKADVHYSYTFF